MAPEQPFEGPQQQPAKMKLFHEGVGEHEQQDPGRVSDDAITPDVLACCLHEKQDGKGGKGDCAHSQPGLDLAALQVEVCQLETTEAGDNYHSHDDRERVEQLHQCNARDRVRRETKQPHQGIADPPGDEEGTRSREECQPDERQSLNDSVLPQAIAARSSRQGKAILVAVLNP